MTESLGFAATGSSRLGGVEAFVGAISVEDQDVGDHAFRGHPDKFGDWVDHLAKAATDEVHMRATAMQAADQLADSWGEARRMRLQAFAHHRS